jgi:hypothetical protein
LVLAYDWFHVYRRLQGILLEILVGVVITALVVIWLLGMGIAALFGVFSLSAGVWIAIPLVFIWSLGEIGPRDDFDRLPPRQWIPGYGRSRYPRDKYGRITGARDR